jgi:hypothetical protein
MSRNDEGYTEGYGYGQGQGQGYGGGYGYGYDGGYGSYENDDGVGHHDGYGVSSFPPSLSINARSWLELIIYF